MKPFRLVNVIVDVAEVSAGITRLDGLAAMEKSGWDWTTKKPTLTL